MQGEVRVHRSHERRAVRQAGVGQRTYCGISDAFRDAELVAAALDETRDQHALPCKIDHSTGDVGATAIRDAAVAGIHPRPP